MVSRLINLTEQLLTLNARSAIGTFTAGEADLVDNFPLETKSQKARSDKHTSRIYELPEHLQPLYDAAKGSCKVPKNTYASWQKIVLYSVLYMEMGLTLSYTYATSELGPEDAEAETRVHGLLQKGVIELCSGTLKT